MRCSPHALGFSRSNPHLTFLPPPVPPCHLTPFPPTFLTLLPHLSPHLSHLATSLLSLPPFPPYHLTSPPYLSHLATSPLSPPFPPCHLISLPTFPTSPPFPTCHHTILLPFPLCHLTTIPPFQPSQLTILPLSQLITLVLLDLTIAISIITNKISHNLTKAHPSPCNTNLRLQIPHTSNSPAPHIHSTSNALTSFK